MKQFLVAKNLIEIIVGFRLSFLANGEAKVVNDQKLDGIDFLEVHTAEILPDKSV